MNRHDIGVEKRDMKMNDERNKILQMVEDGSISAEEAHELLAALPAAGEADGPALPADVTPTPGIPSHLRRYWEFPFAAGTMVAGLGGILISRTSGFFGRTLGWLTFLSGALTALIGWQSRNTPWVHVRIKEQGGARIAISLPLPFDVLGWGLKLAQRLVDEETAENLDTAATLLESLKEMPRDEPLSVEVNDDNGDQVQVYIG